MKTFMRFNKCDDCVTDRSLCDDCKDNPKYRDVPKFSRFTEYTPICPFGMYDCVCDPAYIKKHHPGWYESIWGDITPEEAVKRSCALHKDPSECYDDEDK